MVIYNLSKFTSHCNTHKEIKMITDPEYIRNKLNKNGITVVIQKREFQNNIYIFLTIFYVIGGYLEETKKLYYNDLLQDVKVGKTGKVLSTDRNISGITKIKNDKNETIRLHFEEEGLLSFFNK